MPHRPLPFVLAASDHGPMIVSRLDFAQSPGGFYGVGFQILHTGSYDAPEIDEVGAILDNCRAHNGDGVVFLDCGANIGVHSLSMAKHMLGWGSVRAFEAQERLFYALAGNIALGNFFNITATHAAVGRETGTILMPQPNYQRSGSLGSLELQCSPKTEFIGQPISYSKNNMTPVQMIAIDDLGLTRVDFIKIDVEGMELEVLEGALGTLESHRPVLLIEWIKSGAAAIRDFLIPLGYSLRESGANLIAKIE